MRISAVWKPDVNIQREMVFNMDCVKVLIQNMTHKRKVDNNYYQKSSVKKQTTRA